MNLKIPSTYEADVLHIIKTLNQYGHKAYLVGGCVRDLIMGNQPKDFDFSVSAEPDEVEAIFPSTLAIGKNFGTIQVQLADQTYELTTWRKDFISSNGRHPDRVEFGSLREDAARRDFSINAIYYNPIDAELIDHFNGVKHIAEKKIIFIGDAKMRIFEDRLRILRALRFQAQLGFALDDNTKNAVIENAEMVKDLSWPRLHNELKKTICSPYFLDKDSIFIESKVLLYIFGEQNKEVLYALKSCAQKHNYQEELYLIFLYYHLKVDAKAALLSKEQIKHIDLLRRFFKGEQSVFFLKSNFSNRLGTALFNFLEAVKSEFTASFKNVFKVLPEDYNLPKALVVAADLPNLEGKVLGEKLKAYYEYQVCHDVKTKDQLIKDFKS